MIYIIRFSNYALARINEREIDIELVRLSINEPVETIDVKFNRKACYRKIADSFADSFIVVIFEEQKDEIVIVTVLKVDNTRLIRYGFSGI